MKPRRKVENAIRNRLRFTAGSTLRDRLFTEVMDARSQSQGNRHTLHRVFAGRTIMRTPVLRLTSVAAAILVVALSIACWDRLGAPAYGLEQTVEALQNVRFLHLIERDGGEAITDERWIEIGANGRQARYRQQNPAPRNFLVIDDGESTGLYYHDRRAVVLYDRDERQYAWVDPLGEVLDNLRTEGKILKTNDRCRGRPAHRVWWPALSAECFIDPETKLPIAVGKVQFSYETPPAGTFDIAIPEGYAAMDRRPGAPAEPAPPWLIEQEAIEGNADACFRQGAQALARGDAAQAVESFEYVVKNQEFSNWAWFWLGRAYCALGRYDLAVEKFTRVLETIGDAYPCYYCNYARGLAYAHLGKIEAAETDLRVCLPAMIHTLRIPSTGWMFEFAEDPTIQQGRDMPGDRQILANMVRRLQRITGRDFGYDPNATAEENEAPIAAWERWLREDGRVRFTPGGPPASPSAATEERNH